MEELIDIVSKKLDTFDMGKLEHLNLKTKERILETEKFIQESRLIVENSLIAIKNVMLNKSNLCDSDITSFSRKTIYNDAILHEYINKSIETQVDYLNINKVNELQNNLDTLNELYNNILCDIIDIQILKSKIKELNQEFTFQQEEIERLHIITAEKNKTISHLKSNSKSNNISILPF